MIQVKRTDLGNNKHQLEIEVDALTVKNAYEAAYRSLRNRTDIPGFRKGKVPKDVLKKVVDEREFNQSIYEALVPDAYRQALQQEGIEPAEAPQVRPLQLAEDQPLKFIATVFAVPEVKLGQYKGVEVELPASTVTEQEVNAQVEHIQQERASFDKIALKEIEEGDMVRGAVKATLDGVEVEELSRPETILRLGQESVAGLNFDDMLLGKHVGDVSRGKQTIPDDYTNAELAGKEVEFEIEIKEAYERKVPEVDDAFAAGLGDPDVTDVASLYEKIEQAISEQKTQVQDTALRNDVTQQVVDASEVDVPESMVVRETLRLADDLMHSLEHEHMSLGDYLENKGTPAEGLFSELAEAARFRVKRSLVLEAISKQEHISVNDEDLKEHLQALAAERGVKEWRMKEILREEGRLQALEYAVLQDKVVEFLAENAEKKLLDETQAAADDKSADDAAETETPNEA